MAGDLRKTVLKRQFQDYMDKAEAAERKGDSEAARALYAKALVVRKRMLGQMTDQEQQRRHEIETTRNQQAAGQVTKPAPSQKTQAQDAGMEARIDDALLGERPSTTWADIGGLDQVKDRIREAVRLPWIQELPDFVEPWRGILLHGPPGTGKTMLAKAATNELEASFFQLEAGTVLSKYYGESALIIKEIFQAARDRSPSVIFVDEIDSLTPARTAEVHEETRRALNQFLQEQQGLKAQSEDVLLIGATNAPWDIDQAQISRFQKRIHVPLPDADAREAIIRIHLQSANVDGQLVDDLAAKTDGFSGRDLQAITQEAVMTMVREENPDLAELPMDELRSYRLKTRALGPDDFEAALSGVTGTTDGKLLERYQAWAKEHGRA